jgi:thiol:disulfide interchange protein DsbD
MAKRSFVLIAFIMGFILLPFATAADDQRLFDGGESKSFAGGIADKPAGFAAPKGSVLIASTDDQATYAYAIGAVYGSSGAGLAVMFTGTDDLHYYANEKTAPPGMALMVKVASKGLAFGEPVFPYPKTFVDPLQDEIEVYVGDFAIFFPLEGTADNKIHTVDIEITGLTCTSEFCLQPSQVKLQIQLDLDATAMKGWPVITLGDGEVTATAKAGSNYSWPFAFALAILAGLILNVMPCVWPVIPIIVMRIWNQAQESRAKSMGFGLAFSGGIILFFACLALLNIIMLVGFNTVFQWGDQMRNTPMVIGISLTMIVLALFMFDVFAFGIPASVTAKAGSGSGVIGAVGMGFLAALLSTPCSGALLAAAFVWAQSQDLVIGTVAILLIGVGMSIPYIVLTSVPGLLKKMPKPGGWMEKVKVWLGFLLLLIAVKFFKAVPDDMKINVLYYAVILSVCVWIWGWVNYTTAKTRLRITRLVAVVLAVTAGMWLLPPEKVLIDWQEYDRAGIEELVEEGDPVLIKFDADWCFNCEIVYKLVYKNKEVADLLEQKGVVSFKGDTTTKEMPASVDLSGKYKETGGVPVTILRIDGETISLRGIFDKEDLIMKLNNLPDVSTEE